MKFRKKPVVIEGIQFGPIGHAAEIINWVSDYGQQIKLTDRGLVISTLEGEMIAARHDWIIKGIKGEFYPVKNDIFEATYEKVEE